jgi:hypothetical protein
LRALRTAPPCHRVSRLTVKQLHAGKETP